MKKLNECLWHMGILVVVLVLGFQIKMLKEQFMGQQAHLKLHPTMEVAVYSEAGDFLGALEQPEFTCRGGRVFHTDVFLWFDFIQYDGEGVLYKCELRPNSFYEGEGIYDI